jgi:putative phosphoribosyl transferase
MYFASRMQAGRMLAAQLTPKYRYENCAIIALNDGGVMVATQIAAELHCIITMVVSEEILLPREPIAIGGISIEGSFVYNHEYSDGDIDEMSSEYRNFIEQEKFTKLHKMNEVMGGGGLIARGLLKGHTIIIVSDGMKSSFALDVVLDYLKPINIEKLIVATPLASVAVVDTLHITADEIYILDVPAEFMDTDHYYDTNDVPDHATVVKTIQQIILNWK